MIPSSLNQIFICFLVLLLPYCAISASNSSVSSQSKKSDSTVVLKLKPTQPYAAPKKEESGYLLEENYIHEVNKTSTSVTWFIDMRQILSLFPEKVNRTELQYVTVNVSYHLLYSELSKYHTTIFCQLKDRVLIDQKSMIYQNQCLKEMFAYRMFNEAEHIFNLDLDYLCKKRTKNYIRRINLDNPFTIGDLLPHQSYEFNIEVYMVGEDSEPYFLHRLSDYVCLPDGPPQYPPQTDLASFSITLEGPLRHSLVDLYWRPLPQILTGASDISYELACETDTTINTVNMTIDHLYVGKARITKPSNEMYVCKVTAKNSLGYAFGSSPIVIPDRDHFIDLGGSFRFYAYAVSNEEYYLEWTPIRFNAQTKHADILPRNSTIEPLGGGVFTVYWCVAGRAAGCSSLAGIMRTTSFSSYNLVLPQKSELAPRVFGISYVQASPPMSTGIIWAKCVADFSHQFITEQIRISKVAPIENNHTALSIHWDFVGCDSQIAIIDFYQVNYCKVAELIGCSAAWSSLSTEELRGYKFEETNEHCKTVAHVNKFYNNAIITDLTSAARYIIRLRYVLGNGTANPWSETMMAITLPDPVLVTGCWNKFMTNFALVTLVVSVTLAICCTKSKDWFIYCSLIKSRFKRTTGEICDFVTSVTANDLGPHEASFRYSARGEGGNQLAKAQSELSLSFLASDEQARLTRPNSSMIFRDERAPINRYNQVNQIFDYIPKNMIDGSTDNTTPESSNDSNQEVSKYENTSEQDDISVSSHPFVWDSNDETDFNNNQTIK